MSTWCSLSGTVSLETLYSTADKKKGYCANTVFGSSDLEFRSQAEILLYGRFVTDYTFQTLYFQFTPPKSPQMAMMMLPQTLSRSEALLQRNTQHHMLSWLLPLAYACAQCSFLGVSRHQSLGT